MHAHVHVHLYVFIHTYIHTGEGFKALGLLRCEVRQNPLPEAQETKKSFGFRV